MSKLCVVKMRLPYGVNTVGDVCSFKLKIALQLLEKGACDLHGEVEEGVERLDLEAMKVVPLKPPAPSIGVRAPAPG